MQNGQKTNTTFSERWRLAFRNKKFLKASYIAAFGFVLLATATRFFLVYNESRIGHRFSDPILNLFNPIDLTWLTFLILWFVAIYGIYILAQSPTATLVCLMSYVFLMSFRILSIFLVPLAPPDKMIFLNDPIVSAFTGQTTPVRDLFFSGHTATMFLLYLSVSKFRPFFLLATIAIAFLVVIQHAHYSIDVVMAPFFAYFAFRLGTKLVNYLGVKP